MPKPKPHTLICTVGTSLLTNIQHTKDYPRLSSLLTNQQWGELVHALRRLDPTERICGAEINSIESLIQRRLLEEDPVDLHFCVSDTDDGRSLGAILEAYYEQKNHRVVVHCIPSLQDQNPELFRTEGLRNLVRIIGKIVRSSGAETTAINATGGYKAQIAIAVLIGQALSMSVYYKHERFDTIVAFPPMPISFDWDVLGECGDLFYDLEEKGVVEFLDQKVPERLRPLLEEAPEQPGKSLYALSPIGQIYLEGFRYHFPPEKALPPPVLVHDKQQPSLPDHHYPIGFRDYVKKVWESTPYCKTCRALSYDGQAAIRHRRFYRRRDTAEHHGDVIVGEYKDKNGFGARFAVDTTASNAIHRTAAVDDLNKRFGKE